MSNEEIIKEIEKATQMVHEAARDVNVALCHSRNVVENADDEKAYNKGLEDAWKLARKICGISQTLNKNYTAYDVDVIFGMDCCEVIDEYSYKEALAKIEAYEKEQAEVKVGDVIESIYSGRLGVITMQNKNAHYVLFMDGMAGQLAHDDIKKTGRIMDIKSVLEQLRGDKNEDN